MDISRLTLGEIAKVEGLAGMGIGAMGDDEAPKGKLLAALAFVVKKRTEKDFTFEDALNLTMDEVSDLIGLNVEEDEDPKAKK